MRRLMLAAGLAAILSATSAHAWGQHYVQPYVNNNGTYVGGHYQTNPDNNRFNNWSTQGNVNPYTGQAGTVNPYAIPRPSYRYGGYGYGGYGR